MRNSVLSNAKVEAIARSFRSDKARPANVLNGLDKHPSYMSSLAKQFLKV